MKWTWVLLLLSACSSAPPPATDNAGAFLRLLRARQLAAAGRFELYFRGRNDAPAAVMAQYYLSTCQPRAAARAIGRLADPGQRRLFESTLAALVSIQRPELAAAPYAPVSQSDRNGTLSESPTVVTSKTTGPLVDVADEPAEPLRREPIDAGEIWADEWAELSVRGSQRCLGMPVIADSQLRAEYRERARAGFASLSAADFARDWSLVALALDLDVVPPDAHALLTRYLKMADDPYFRRLQRRLNALPAVPLRARARHGAEIDLGELQLVKWVELPHPITTPWLLGEGSASL